MELSMRTIKTMNHNKLIAERIFSNLGLDLGCKKIKQIYEQCTYTGIRAASLLPNYCNNKDDHIKLDTLIARHVRGCQVANEVKVMVANAMQMAHMHDG